MTAKNDIVVKAADLEVVITRVINAPRELVYKAWTEPESLANWWGPKGFTNTISEMEVKPGGVCRLVMRAPDGAEYRMKKIYRDAVPPEMLAYTHAGEEGVGVDTFDVVVTFAERSGKTELTVRNIFATIEYRDRFKNIGGTDGWNQSFEKLGELLLK